MAKLENATASMTDPLHYSAQMEAYKYEPNAVDVAVPAILRERHIVY